MSTSNSRRVRNIKIWRDGCTKMRETGSPAHGTEKSSDTNCSHFRLGRNFLLILPRGC